MSWVNPASPTILSGMRGMKTQFDCTARHAPITAARGAHLQDRGAAGSNHSSGLNARVCHQRIGMFSWRMTGEASAGFEGPRIKTEH